MFQLGVIFMQILCLSFDILDVHFFYVAICHFQCPNDDGIECSNFGLISLTTFYFIAEGDKSLKRDSRNRFSNGEICLMVGLSPEGPWMSISSVLPLSTIPKELNGTFGVEVVMQKGQKHAILRSLFSIVNNTDITLEVCVCPLSLLNSTDVQLSSDTNRPVVETEEIFENQRYNPLLGWGNKRPGLLMSNDPGRWSINDYSYSSKVNTRRIWHCCLLSCAKVVWDLLPAPSFLKQAIWVGQSIVRTELR